MKKVSNKQTNDYIVEILKDNIISGNISEDDDITQEDLAETLNVSRMPVREAIAKLIQEGFLERLPNRRVRVIKLTKYQINDVFKLMTNIIKQMICIIENDTVDVESFKDLQLKVNGETNIDKLIYLEVELHELIAKSTNNKYLELMFDKVFNGYIVYGIKKYGTVGDKKKYMNEIINIIINKNFIDKEIEVEQYYEYYANEF